MAQNLAKQLEELHSRREIGKLWVELYGRAQKLPSRREFVISLLAYRLQERGYGGLNATTRKRLRGIAAAIAADTDTDVVGQLRIKPGARLIREWQGEIHQVTVIEEGFLYSGKRYRSLSEIARRITGTRWSGPLFFGLKKAPNRLREEIHVD